MAKNQAVETFMNNLTSIDYMNGATLKLAVDSNGHKAGTPVQNLSTYVLKPTGQLYMVVVPEGADLEEGSITVETTTLVNLDGTPLPAALPVGPNGEVQPMTTPTFNATQAAPAYPAANVDAVTQIFQQMAPQHPISQEFHQFYMQVIGAANPQYLQQFMTSQGLVAQPWTPEQTAHLYKLVSDMAQQPPSPNALALLQQAAQPPQQQVQYQAPPQQGFQPQGAPAGFTPPAVDPNAQQPQWNYQAQPNGQFGQAQPGAFPGGQAAVPGAAAPVDTGVQAMPTFNPQALPGQPAGAPALPAVPVGADGKPLTKRQQTALKKKQEKEAAAQAAAAGQPAPASSSGALSPVQLKALAALTEVYLLDPANFDANLEAAVEALESLTP
jgi:hypothetical protein